MAFNTQKQKKIYRKIGNLDEKTDALITHQAWEYFIVFTISLLFDQLTGVQVANSKTFGLAQLSLCGWCLYRLYCLWRLTK